MQRHKNKINVLLLLQIFPHLAGTHLQRGEDYLVHGGEVGVPQHLGPLSEGQDSLVPHCSDRGGHLKQTVKNRHFGIQEEKTAPALLAEAK